jgi:hypothetical protein
LTLEHTVVLMLHNCVLSYATFDCYVAQSLLAHQGNFRFELEDDGSLIDDDVMSPIIEANEKIGTLMLLREGEVWSPG